MSDKLKQFIDENRQAFDTDVPQPKLWDAVEQKLNRNKKSSLFNFRRPMAWAASLTGLIILSAAIYSLVQKDSTGNDLAGPANDSKNEFVDVLDPIQAQQITQFQEVIELKQNELKQLEKEQPALYKEFISDINSLDSAYTMLKTKLPENPNREMLLEAMISNLQMQSDLLTRQLKIIKEIKQKSIAHEKQRI
jgi:hypothetical protein